MAKLKFGNENIRKAYDANNAERTIPSIPTVKDITKRSLICFFLAAKYWIIIYF
jgi:hypothetical protein